MSKPPVSSEVDELVAALVSKVNRLKNAVSQLHGDIDRLHGKIRTTHTAVDRLHGKIERTHARIRILRSQNRVSRYKQNQRRRVRR